MHLEKKKKTYLFRKYTTEEGLNCMHWCLENNMKVIPVPKDNVIYLDVIKKKKVFRIPETFTNRNLTDAIYRVYIKLYETYGIGEIPLWKTKILKSF